MSTTPLRALPPEFAPYRWALPTDAVARLAGIDVSQVVRFDQNTPPLPLPSTRPGTVAGALARVNGYPAGGYRELRRAIADYAGVAPENVVLGAGADDLILLCARAFAGPGDTISIPQDPTYALYRIAAELAGAARSESDAWRPASSSLEAGLQASETDKPVLTFFCNPNNPTGELSELPAGRPLVVDEAYFEYAGVSALPLLDEGVVVLRTFSKAFGLAGARIGYSLAARELAEELNARQAPAPVSTISAALALAALAAPPEVAPVLEERERLASGLRGLGLEPAPSHANFLWIPLKGARAIEDRLLQQGIVVRGYDEAIRVSVLDREDDDLLLAALARVLDRPAPVAEDGGRTARTLRATAETRFRTRLALDGSSRVRVATGAGLYDHLFEQLAFHGGLDLTIEGVGDAETGDHHTAEDAALALGEALDKALGDRRGIARYGDATCPMDDALARAAVDLGGRAWAELSIDPDPGMAEHALRSLAQAGRLALHVEASGRDPHHVAEAAFKAVGRALRQALRPEGAGVPSTKGLL